MRTLSFSSRLHISVHLDFLQPSHSYVSGFLLLLVYWSQLHGGLSVSIARAGMLINEVRKIICERGVHHLLQSKLGLGVHALALGTARRPFVVHSKRTLQSSRIHAVLVAEIHTHCA